MKSIVVGLMLISLTGFAHDQHLTGMTLELGKDNSGVLHMSLPQYSIEKKIQVEHPEINLALLSSLEFQKLVVTHLKSVIAIQQNGEPCPFTTGIIKHDGHEVKVKLGVSNVSDKSEEIYVKINSQNKATKEKILLSVRQGTKRSKVILSQKNGFTAKIDLSHKEPTITAMKAGVSDGLGFFWLTGVITLFGIVVLFITFKRQTV